jgi:hypothetical protein
MGARLSNAVLQLALQQVQRHFHQHRQHHHHHQQQQQQHSSKGVFVLVGSARRLLRGAAEAASTYVRGETFHNVVASPVFPYQTAAAATSSSAAAPDDVQSMRLLFGDLETGLLRMSALADAVAAAPWVTSQRQQVSAGVAPPTCSSAAPAAATAAGPGAVSAGGACLPSGSSGEAPHADAALAWCSTHSSGPAPSAVRAAELWQQSQLKVRIFMTSTALGCTAAESMVLGCGHGGCKNMDGPSEAGLVANRRGALCSRCGVVRYCSPACARLAWPLHRKVCVRLAAALGRNTASSANDAAFGRDQGLAPGGRVCAWCGKASQQLLRCGRCKAAWYCGADHQRAAWKAGHKQECGGGGSPAVTGSVS